MSRSSKFTPYNKHSFRCCWVKEYLRSDRFDNPLGSNRNNPFAVLIYSNVLHSFK